MTPKKEYALRLGIAATIGPAMFFSLLTLSDYVVGTSDSGRFLSAIGACGGFCLLFGVAIGFGVYGLTKDVDLFEPAEPVQRRKTRWMALPWLCLFVIQLAAYLRHDFGKSTLFTRLAFIIVDAGLMAWFMWTVFGKWYRTKIAGWQPAAPQANTGIGQG